ncbi:Interleukin-17 receptor E [Oryzias melastigma]|uniref:Interleukin-17 receptor E n=1 Tax=Oryzias melastigma TaxID=30732 RepID=A0A834C2J1_ORYME|nr:Interleukin-17 receptor E [Oryzias melastigma]
MLKMFCVPQKLLCTTQKSNGATECPAPGLNLSASLCWKLQEHLCVPVPNSVLKKTDKLHLMFNTSGVDVHPQMCVKFSLQDKHNISCLYQNEKPGWEADIGAGRQSMVVHLTSSTPGNFSAQLCVLTDSGCTPVGPIHSVAMTEDVSKKNIEVSVDLTDEKPCVQVWKSDPALIGRRILCLDYTRNRSGTYAAAAVMSGVVFLLLGMVIRRVIKSVTEDWLVIQKPLLLVCSSDQSTHVSAVCALASILHGKLGATVHTALWAQSSQKPSASGAGVADLGPVPWLYGQWEAVCKAQGKVLIVWSPDAKKTYERWRLERRKNQRAEDCRKENPRQEKIRAEEEELLNSDSRKVGKWKKAARKKDAVQMCEEGDGFLEKEPSAVIEPVFVAALASLEGALRGCKDQQVAIVYFQGLCHSKDIPKDLRGISRYCLPQDFSGLLQELGMERGAGHWPRLPSKLLSTWLARRLARRLQTLLLQMKGQSLSSSAK